MQAWCSSVLISACDKRGNRAARARLGAMRKKTGKWSLTWASEGNEPDAATDESWRPASTSETLLQKSSLESKDVPIPPRRPKVGKGCLSPTISPNIPQDTRGVIACPRRLDALLQPRIPRPHEVISPNINETSSRRTSIRARSVPGKRCFPWL